MERFHVTVVALNEKTETQLWVEVDEAEESENFVIAAEIWNQKLTISNEAYYPAYQEFRDALLRLGFGIKCNGSKINAVQSAMMGACDQIYLVEMGKQARLNDLVSLWAYAELDAFPDTRQQDSFHAEWGNSLRKR